MRTMTGPAPGYYTAVEGGEVDAEGHFHPYVTEEDVVRTYHLWARRLLAAASGDRVPYRQGQGGRASRWLRGMP